MVSASFVLVNNESTFIESQFPLMISSPKYLNQIKAIELEAAQGFGVMSVFMRCRSGFVFFFHSARLADSHDSGVWLHTLAGWHEKTYISVVHT